MKDYKDEYEIVPRATKVVPKPKPFEKKKVGYTTGKSSKYLKEVTIPHLRRQIKDLKDQLREKRTKIIEVKNSNKEIVKNQVKKERKKQVKIKRNASLRASRITRVKLREMARKVYYDKINVQRMHNSNYIDGITAFPILYKWCVDNKFKINDMCLFIVINHHEWFTMDDGRAFGYTDYQLKPILRNLIKMNLINVNVSKINNWFSNVNGKELFNQFELYYQKQTKSLFAKMANMNPLERRKGSSGIVYAKRYSNRMLMTVGKLDLKKMSKLVEKEPEDGKN